MELIPFKKWSEVLEYARGGGELYYKAPLDHRATRFMPQTSAPAEYTYVVRARTIKMWPPGSVGRGRNRTSDPFSADSGHLDRFSHPAAGHSNMEAHREPADEHAATELVLYIENTSDLSPDGPSGQGREILKNALRKWRKGTYDSTKAVRLFEYLAESGAKRYAKEYGEERKWSEMFNPATRHEAAKQLEASFRNSAEIGEYDHVDTRTGVRDEVGEHVSGQHKLIGPGTDGLYTYRGATIELSGPAGGKWWATVRFRSQEIDIEARSSDEALEKAKDWIDSAPETQGWNTKPPDDIGGPYPRVNVAEADPSFKWAAYFESETPSGFRWFYGQFLPTYSGATPGSSEQQIEGYRDPPYLFKRDPREDERVSQAMRASGTRIERVWKLKRSRKATEESKVATPRMDAFTRAYFETALWSSTDESNDQGGDPLDDNYSIDDIAPETRDQMIKDCADFQERYYNLMLDGTSEQGGHDFWLTRNRHGAGFWDGDWKHGDELTKAAHEYGEFNLYVGDDGQIYGQ